MEGLELDEMFNIGWNKISAQSIKFIYNSSCNRYKDTLAGSVKLSYSFIYVLVILMHFQVKFKFLLVYPAATKAFSLDLMDNSIRSEFIRVRLVMIKTGIVNLTSTTPHWSIESILAFSMPPFFLR